MFCIHVQDVVFGVKQTRVSNFFKENEAIFSHSCKLPLNACWLFFTKHNYKMYHKFKKVFQFELDY